MIIAQYFTEFLFYSFLGWVWESIYCTAKEHHWQDRGFLFGPVCPIYGASVILASVLFTFVPSLSSPSLPLWQVFLICMLGSAVMEYSTSWVLEKKYHARWWDYSELPLNLNGRICLPVSICFGLAGVVIVKYLLPFVSGMHARLPGLFYEASAIGLAILLGADIALTQASLTSLLKEIETVHQEFNERAEAAYVRVQETPEKIGESITEKKSELIEEAAERKMERDEQRAQRKAQIRQKLESVQLAGIAKKHAGHLSNGSRRMLRNIVSFHPDVREETYNGHTSGEHLKEALKRLEEKGL